MNDIVIQAKNLKKIYRLYAGPGYRFLDMFGMLRKRVGAYTEHAALDGVNLEIRQGEKVAIIGRNGAGKSTLLKLITRVIEPSSGTIDVKGHAHALLQIGTGFHPDFTGRQNVYAYLAQLGVAGKRADEKYGEIVDFAEIEEYIDQPVKTYSSGMAVRLMFATATAIAPELLVLDEVLGVGDAYFARKSSDRMRELCERDKTTLLLVSHDVYTASKICNRMIWLDRGRIVADLEPRETLTLYEDAIRLQEETRLRKKSVEVIRRSLTEIGVHREVCTVEVAFAGSAPIGPVYIGHIEILANEARLAYIALGDDKHGLIDAELIAEGSAWSEPLTWSSRPCRALQPFGSVFGHVAAAFTLPENPAGFDRALSLRLEMGADAPTEVVVRAFMDSRPWANQRLSLTAEWQSVTVVASGEQSSAALGVRSTIGTGAVALMGVRIYDAGDRETNVLVHGKPAIIEVDYEIRDPELTGPLDFAISILRGGVDTACRFFTRDLPFAGTASPVGTVRLHMPSVILGVGTYSATIMFARHGYADEDGHAFYSINPGVYVCVRDVLEFEVRGGNLFATGTSVLAEGEWKLVPTKAASR